VEYRPRVLDGRLASALEAAGAVVIEGVKASGKTETGRQAARSEVRIDTVASHQMMTVAPELLLEGEPPLLLDEWQVEERLWNYVRHAVDDRQLPGQFILTGSALASDDPTRHPGAGRFIRLRMRPMTLAEVGYSTGDISFAAVLQGQGVRAPQPGLTVPDIAERIVVGGWPAHLGLTASQAQRLMSGYIDDVSREDIQRVDGIRRDPDGVRRVITSLARNVATPATLELITADAAGTDVSLKIDTVRTYYASLKRLMIVDDLADPALAAAALRATPAMLLHDLNTMGYLFESMVVRDLRVYAEAQEASVFHYRDELGLEVDAIVEMADGRWAGFEVKLGSSPEVCDVAAEHLLKLRDKVAGQPPIALGVITATGFGFVRRDGVLQIPIGALAP